MVEPNTGSSYHFQPDSRLKQILGYFRSTPYNQAVVVFYYSLEFLRRKADLYVYINTIGFLEHLNAHISQLVTDQHLQFCSSLHNIRCW
jgi:hypothetical protein